MGPSRLYPGWISLGGLAFVLSLLPSPAASLAGEAESGPAVEDSELPAPSEADRAATERAEMLRTKTEWFALRTHGGNYGGGLMASLLTLRWRHFYWDVLRGGGGSTGRTAGWGVGGTVGGVALHIGNDGKHEVRVGLGVLGGIVSQWLRSPS